MKAQRQAKIIEIIGKYDIETQDELAEKLIEAGFNATQATISRDIREMKLTKLAYQGGKQKYIALQNQDYHTTQKYKRVLSAAIISMDIAQNIIVVKTVSGMAMACGAAIDSLDIPGLVGSIAGDDTVFCAARDNEIAKSIVSHISKAISQREDKK